MTKYGTLEGRWGSTDEFATIPFYLVLFSAALVELVTSNPSQSLILSSYLFSSLPLLLFSLLCPVGSSLVDQRTLRRRQPPQFSFLDHGQEFIVFCDGCLDLFANLLIGNMVLVRNSMAFGSISSQSLTFFSVALQSRFMIHRHIEIWK